MNLKLMSRVVLVSKRAYRAGRASVESCRGDRTLARNAAIVIASVTVAERGPVV
jgi:hypothetical protein